MILPNFNNVKNLKQLFLKWRLFFNKQELKFLMNSLKNRRPND